MPELPLIEPENTDDATGILLATAHQMCGLTPNLFKAMANSTAALRGYLDLAGALRDGGISASAGARIALLVAQEHRNDYCVSAHTFIGTRVHGLTADAAIAARAGVADDPKTVALLNFAGALVRHHGHVPDAELAAAHAELSPAEIVEVVAQVALGVFGNYLASAARVANDWPLVRHDVMPLPKTS
ncbi:carboxymuconolactone decarboxylase family protein [Nocardia colli]|uniref:carboxymuconolactone decarboxylase family protein n=1 Tax=Nocardia colli TaxID=2545717 RepID=UPI0035DFF465